MTVRYYKRQVKKDWRNKTAHWSDVQKFEAVTLYLMVGKWPLVSQATHIPIDTLKKWKQADWWKEYEDEIRRAKHVETSTKLSKIRDKASDVVMDRLENGDFQYNPKTGKFSRKPVSAKVAGEIMVKTLDKEILLEKIDEKPAENEQSIMERLNSIADKLLQASSKKPRLSEVIDVEPIKEASHVLEVAVLEDRRED
jgi:hypothetical protein